METGSRGIEMEEEEESENEEARSAGWSYVVAAALQHHVPSPPFTFKL